MSHHHQFYIDGEWVEPAAGALLDVEDPSIEEPFTKIAIGSRADVDRAVAAARRAFTSFAETDVADRLALLRRVLAAYDARAEDLARALSREMGAPIAFARNSQVAAGKAHLVATIGALETFPFCEQRGTTRIQKEPIGVCALITPWNWPLNQIVCKVAPAIAAGCTMVLKPSEVAPLSGLIFAEIMEAAATPAGVFNLVNGRGDEVGHALAAHRDVDMVSFTGSTRAGISVAKAAADTVKRVSQELGGKSANIILRDADFDQAVRDGVEACFGNSGQSCDAPTRMLVPAEWHDDALQIAREAAEGFCVGNPQEDGVDLGPVVNLAQFNKVQRLIDLGIEEGALLVAGGPGRPEGLNRGYYVRPTIFGHVTADMTIAREEIFGPVLSILSYETEEEAIEIANDTIYGLAAYVQSGDLAHARRVAGRLRAGSVYLNYPDWDTSAPFGGYKQSGNGREYADWGIHDFLEIKGIVGWGKPDGG